MTGQPVLAYSRNTGGHRAAWLAQMKREFAAERAPLAALWFAPGPVLFLMIEENFALYALLCCLRSVLGRRTVGFCHRPGPAARGRSLRLRTKRLVLRVLRLLPPCQTLMLLPFAVDDCFAEIADGWVYDPQLWDLSSEDVALAARLRSDHRNSPRRRVVALGRQGKAKGFDAFVIRYTQSEDLRHGCDFAAYGPIAAEVRPFAEALVEAGGSVTDRVLSDSELLAAYAQADLIWVAYATSYDQPSGIAGRAVQLGIPVVVRPGSLLERFCRLEDIAHATPDTLLSAPLVDAGAGAGLAARFGAQARAAIRAAMGREASEVAS